MITSKVFLRGGYGDCAPLGYAVPIGGTHLDTKHGRVEFMSPNREPRWLRISDGATKLAGQCANDLGGVQYFASLERWEYLDQTVGGMWPVIYDNDGELHIRPVGPHLPVNGYRYVTSDNRLIGGEVTQGPCPMAPRLTEWSDLSRDGRTLIIGQGDRGGAALFDGAGYRLIINPNDPATNVLQPPAFTVGIHGRIIGQDLAFHVHLSLLQPTQTICLWMTVEDVASLPKYPDVDPPPVEPPADHFRPISEPLPIGTTMASLERYFIPQLGTMPRTGKHTIHWHTQGDRHFFCKFFDPKPVTAPTPFHSKAHYEEYRFGRDFFHQVCDRSNGTNQPMDCLSDTRWVPRIMQIGEQFAWLSAPHDLVKIDSTTCQEVDRGGWTRRMGLLKAWGEFEAGRDFPNIPVAMFLYDPTGGAYAHDRHIEIGYQGLDVGPLAWESYRTAKDPVSGLPGCYDTGVLVLNERTIGRNPDGSPMRSTFYHKGGVAWVPQIAPCALSISPEHPPIDPPIPPVPPMTNGLLTPGQRLLADKPLISQDGRFRLLYQSDGNLVEYGPNGPMWATGTNGQSVGSCDMQGDGNFVLYDKQGKPRWATGTNGHSGSSLLVQNDGNIVLYAPQGKAVWASHSVYVPPPTPEPGPIEPVVPIRVDGKVFRRPNGTIYNAKSASGFLDLRRLLEGDEAGLRVDYAKWYALGCRERRVFSRVDWNGVPGPGLFPEQYPDYWAKFNRLFAIAAEYGLHVEMVALTGPIRDGQGDTDYNAMAQWAARVRAERITHINGFVELTNEPEVNGIDIRALMSRLDTSSWAEPWSTGQYSPTAEPAGTFCTVHTDRVDGWEWVRKAVKDILEYREGGGPQNSTDPAMNRPIKGDEPMGAASFFHPGRRDNVPVHHYTAGYGSMLFGAGYCVHSESGLTSVFPTGLELECIAAAFKGMHAIGPEWQLGTYGRVGLADFPILVDDSVRTYGMLLNGRWKVVRIGPTTNMPASLVPGWRVEKVDSFGGLNIGLELARA